MSWHFSQALEEAYLLEVSSGGDLYALWKSTLPARKSSCNGKMRGICHRSPFGTMYVPSKGENGQALLTWYREGSHVRTLVSPAAEMGWTVSDPAYGWKWPESFVKYDLATRSWKTRQCSLQGDLTEYLETWPCWGLMRDGECSQLAPLVLHKHEKECSSWPTPCARDYRGVHRTERGLQRRQESKRGIPLNEAVGGLLNPTWVEWLMGWPEGWTGFAPLETDKFQAWQRSHGGH